MSEMQRAAKVRGAFGDGVAATTVRYYTVAATHKAHAVPNSWCGRYVNMVGTVAFDYFFSTLSGAEVDATVTATDDGTSSNGVKLGESIAASTPTQRQIPQRQPNQTIYFVREAGGNGSIKMTLVDDPDEML